MELAKLALQARLDGRYQEADILFARAYQTTSGGIDTADLLFNWADTVRRMPGGEELAREYIQKALGILEPHQPVLQKEYAACVHHLGRLERQAGNSLRALAHIEQSIWCIRVCNRNRDVPYIDTLTMLLDAASLRALNGFPWRARLAALQALAWTFRSMSEPAELAHRKRAMALFVFADRPHSRFGFVRRAFFGREVSMEQ